MHNPEVEHPMLDVHGWPTRAPSLAALAEAIKARGVPDASYFLQSAVPDGDGWQLLFDPDEMMDVQRHGLGDWWPDWLGSSCPALLLRGAPARTPSSTSCPASRADRPSSPAPRIPATTYHLGLATVHGEPATADRA
jgi:hypothetical protein